MSQRATHFDPTTGQELRVNAPMRPDLKPGETVTYAPDRWCEACSQARGTRLCPICGGQTVLKSELSPVDAVPLSFERPMSVSLPADPGALELEQLEQDDEPLSDEEVRGAVREALDEGRLVMPDAAELEQLEHPSTRGTRTQLEPPGDRTRARQTEDVDVPSRRKRIVDVTPPAARMESPFPVRDKRRRVPLFNLPDRGAAIMDRSVATAQSRRIPQRDKELDDQGREVHRTGNARRARSLEDTYEQLWNEGKLNKDTWTRFAAAAASTGAEAETAAAYADELYMQLILREQKQ